MKKKNNKITITSKELFERLSVIMMRMLPFSTALPEIFDLLRDLTKERTALDKKVVLAHKALQETSALLSELESGLKERADKLSRIKAEYDQYSKLAQVEEEKAQILLQQIELTVSKGKGKERVISLILNLLAGIVVFVLGVGKLGTLGKLGTHPLLLDKRAATI